MVYSDGRASGVRYALAWRRRTAQARHEVIVSGGTYGSPQLMQLSGLGPGEHLQAIDQPALRPYIAREIAPGQATSTAADIAAFVRQTGLSNHHPSSTFVMGNGTNAVVNARLRAYGVQGLRVADASVMPTVVAGNTNAPAS